MRSGKGPPKDDSEDGATAGPGYPHFQLAKALRRIEETGDPRAVERAEKWRRVISGMLSGHLTIGSKTPISGVPAWVTPEVVRGGFATGGLQAGGDLRQHELGLAAELGIPVGSQTRACLNGYFVSDAGLERLQDLLQTGCFRAQVPEESALLIVAWLIQQNKPDSASAILEVVAPYFDRLRFFPRPADEPLASGEDVHLQDVGTTIAQLRTVGKNQNIDAQGQAINVWIPLYDRMVALLLETVDEATPRVAVDANGKPLRDEAGRYDVSGGLPCSVFPDGWQDRALSILDAHKENIGKEVFCKGRIGKGTPYARLLAIIEQCTTDRDKVSDFDRYYARLVIARYLAKRGLPGSDQCRMQRKLQARQCEGPTYKELAGILIARLEKSSQDHGLHDAAGALTATTAEEAESFCVPVGSNIPPRFAKIVNRSQIGTVEDLVNRGLLSSCDMLATVLPQMTAGVNAGHIPNGDLARVYAETYRAFRRRRSLLLLNLESQTRFDELPWIAALSRYERRSAQEEDIARRVLTDVSILALRHFPYAILPNTLLQEMRALFAQADLSAPLLDELAADIFMGKFSTKYVAAAKIAAALMLGSLYEKYYGIDYSSMLGWRSRSRSYRHDADNQKFTELCWALSGNHPGGNWSVAINGTVIEQQQIVTTQNLATVFSKLNLVDAFGSDIAELAKKCFLWICNRQALPMKEHRSKLITLKNTAYAWRQMIFFLSFLPKPEQSSFLEWIQNELADQRSDFATRFRPGVIGLNNVLSGNDVTLDGGRRFLGWAVGRHWLLPKGDRKSERSIL